MAFVVNIKQIKTYVQIRVAKAKPMMYTSFVKEGYAYF